MDVASFRRLKRVVAERKDLDYDVRRLKALFYGAWKMTRPFGFAKFRFDFSEESDRVFFDYVVSAEKFTTSTLFKREGFVLFDRPRSAFERLVHRILGIDLKYDVYFTSSKAEAASLKAKTDAWTAVPDKTPREIDQVNASLAFAKERGRIHTYSSSAYEKKDVASRMRKSGYECYDEKEFSENGRLVPVEATESSKDGLALIVPSEATIADVRRSIYGDD